MAEEHVLRVPIKAGMVERVLSHLTARATRQKELDQVYAARHIHQNIVFVSEEAGESVLFIYRRGRDLQAAGAKFLAEDSPVDRELTRLLLEATDFERAKILPVVFRWPPLERS